MKAAVLKFYIPIVAVLTIAGVAVGGLSLLPNILLGLFNEVLIVAMMVYAGSRIFPFSILQQTKMKGGSFLRNVVVLFLSAMVALGHFLIFDFPVVVLICIGLSLSATWLLTTSIRNTPWSRINRNYEAG